MSRAKTQKKAKLNPKEKRKLKKAKKKDKDQKIEPTFVMTEAGAKHKNHDQRKYQQKFKYTFVVRQHDKLLIIISP